MVTTTSHPTSRSLSSLCLGAALAASVAAPASAVVVYTGGDGEVDLFDAASYDFSGSTLTAIGQSSTSGGQNPNADDISFTGASFTGIGYLGFGTLATDDGFTLSFDNTSFTAGGRGGLGGFNGGGPSFVSIANGSDLDLQFVERDVQVSVDGTSSLNLRGGGDPINSTVGGTASSLNFAAGARLTLASRAEFDEQGDEIFVNGVSFNADNSVFTFDGATATAVPEPATLGLLGVGALLLTRRRAR